MNSADTLRATEQFLQKQIPLTRAMQVRVESFDDRQLTLAAPLAANHNHLGTAFGGSLAALAMLTGYALLWLELGDRSAHIVISESTLQFRRPVQGELRATCLRQPDELATFRETFAHTGKARLKLEVVIEANGETRGRLHRSLRREEVDSFACHPNRQTVTASARVKFSLLLELQIASPTPETERQLFHDTVAQAVLAEECGYHGVWAVEHHGLYEYSHCYAPEVLLSFLAARTSRLLLGHAVTLTPSRYNHPLRVAERIATLDILSQGRVRWGSGKSASLTEQTTFQIDRATLDGQWREALEMIPKMWRSDVFEWHGEFYDIPPTAILPKPVQRPHPPIFAACSRPESVALAGTLGVGSLNFAAGSDEQLLEKIRLYRESFAHTTAPASRANNYFCCTPARLVLEDDLKACAYGFRGARFFGEALGTYFFSPQRIVGPLDIAREPLPEQKLNEQMAKRTQAGSQMVGIFGDPVAARESVARFQEAGVDELILGALQSIDQQDSQLRPVRTKNSGSECNSDGVRIASWRLGPKRDVRPQGRRICNRPQRLQTAAPWPPRGESFRVSNCIVSARATPHGFEP